MKTNYNKSSNSALSTIIGVLLVGIIIVVGLMAFNIIDNPITGIASNDIQLTTKSLEMRRGEVTTLDVINDSGDALEFISSDPSIVSVNEITGYVKANKAGTAIIIVSLKNHKDIKDECTITVIEPVSTISANSITLSDYRIKRLKRNINLNSDLEKSEYINKVLEEASKINDEIHREFILKKLEKEFDISYNTLEKRLLSFIKNDGKEDQKIDDLNLPAKKQEVKKDKYYLATYALLYCMLINKECLEYYNKGKINFLNGTSQDLQAGQFEVDYSALDTTEEGVYTVQIKYSPEEYIYNKLKGQTYTADIQVKVFSIKEIVLGFNETVSEKGTYNGTYVNHTVKTIYKSGDQYDPSYLSVTAHATLNQENGDEEYTKLLSTDEYEIDMRGEEITSSGDVVVTYTTNEKPKTATYAVYVVNALDVTKDTYDVKYTTSMTVSITATTEVTTTSAVLLTGPSSREPSMRPSSTRSPSLTTTTPSGLTTRSLTTTTPLRSRTGSLPRTTH